MISLWSTRRRPVCIDLFARRWIDGRAQNWAYQCKRHARFTATDVREAVKALRIKADVYVDQLLDRLRREFGLVSVVDPKDTRKGDHIRVVTLSAATGLESPIGFLCGKHQLYEEEQSLRLSEDEHA